MAERKKASKTTKSTVKKTTKVSKTVKDLSEKQNIETPTTTKGLSPIKTLVQESWRMYKQTFTSYLKLLGIGLLLVISVVIIGALLSLPLLLTSSGGVFSNPSMTQILALALLVLYAIVSFFIMYMFSLFLPIASIFIFDSEKKLSLSELFKKAKPLLWPYFVTMSLVGVVMIGGWVLFIVPGVLFALFFVFVAYVVVLEKKKWVAALKRSFQLVKPHFWEVFVRVLLLQAGMFAVSYILERLAKEHDFYSLLSFLFSVFVGWFAQIYIYHLYKELVRKTHATKDVSLRWIWIVSAVGWVIILGLIIAVISGVIQLPNLDSALQMDDSELLGA